ncbi:hypothetical protein [Kitasatospora kifunensis]|uniref:Uncharacterized protein n=1 Tax=Kitasatospora kifunensis TaxID=58351 RepID=A0A7W7RC64_KITKI|nr:hypothetical protein [Kitasatospora kifunensis]MBB4929135.1 hypothetical protein [Kitasatospora kifunensis]
MGKMTTMLAALSNSLLSPDPETRMSAAWAVLEAAGAAALAIEHGPGALAALAAYDHALEARDLLPFPQDEPELPALWDADSTKALGRLLEVVAVEMGNDAQAATEPGTAHRLSRAALLARQAGQALTAAGAAA